MQVVTFLILPREIFGIISSGLFKNILLKLHLMYFVFQKIETFVSLQDIAPLIKNLELQYI